MNKLTYMKILKRHLNSVTSKERKDFLADIEEHFLVGMQNGKSEEEMIEELGTPEEVAKSYIEEHEENSYNFSKTTNKGASGMTRMVIAAIGVLLLNLLIVIWPICGIIGMYVGLCATAIGCIVSPLGIFYQVFFFFSAQDVLFTLFSSLALCGVGILLSIVLMKIGKWLYFTLVRYVKFNIQIVVGG